MREPASLPPGFGGRYLTDFAIRSAYSEGAGPYRIVPAAVAIPAGPEDLVRLIEHAVEARTPLVPRGAGSGIPGGNVGRGIIVDLRGFESGPSIDKGSRVCCAGAAVTWADLDRAAAREGCRLPPNPSSGAFCTVGGMTATDAAGSRSVRYGSMRRWVRGVELATSDGELGWIRRGTGEVASPAPLRALARFDRDVRPAILRNAPAIEERFPRTTKNTSGYALEQFLHTSDPVDLVIGSEGTLGIITQVELELQERPGATSALLLVLDDLDRLGEVVERLLALDPSAVELLDRTLLRFAAADVGNRFVGAECVLLVEFERESNGDARATARQAERIGADCARSVETALDEAARERLWAVRHSASPALAKLGPKRRSLQIVEDGCVPVSHLDQYLRGTRRIAGHLGIDIVAFGHAGDGHLHINALVDPSLGQLEERLTTLLREVTDLVVDLGGTPSGEHGDGRLRAAILDRLYGTELVDLFGQVKHAFDPHGVMNPGVIVPEADTSAIRSLKVGPGAERIPNEIAEQLAELERSGGWGVRKTNLASRSVSSH